MCTTVFLTAFAVLAVAILTTTRAGSLRADRRARRRAALVVRRPEVAAYDDLAAQLAGELDAHAADDLVACARWREIPAPLLLIWVRRHGAAVTADAVGAGLSVAQLRRHAHSLAGLDLESVTLSAELHRWSCDRAAR